MDSMAATLWPSSKAIFRPSTKEPFSLHSITSIVQDHCSHSFKTADTYTTDSSTNTHSSHILYPSLWTSQRLKFLVTYCSLLLYSRYRCISYVLRSGIVEF